GETFLMQLHPSRPEPRLSTFERCWLSGATGLAQRTGDTRDLFALRSPGSVSPLCPTCASVKANGAARKARERDKRATETRLRKVAQICGNPAGFSPRRLFCELRGWGYAARLRAKISAGTLVRALVTKRIAEMAGIAAIFCPIQR